VARSKLLVIVEKLDIARFSRGERGECLNLINGEGVLTNDALQKKRKIKGLAVLVKTWPLGVQATPYWIISSVSVYYKECRESLRCGKNPASGRMTKHAV
jgi:hypothetical protein